MTQQNDDNQELPTIIDELEGYINKLPKDIDRAVRLEIPEEQQTRTNPTSIRGLPIYIVGRIVKNENNRTKLIEALKRNGFKYDETPLNAIIENASEKRETTKTVENKRNIPTPIQTEEQKQRMEERRNKEEETKKREEERIENEKQQKLLLEEAKQRKIKEDKQFKSEQEEIKRELETNKQIMKKEAEAKRQLEQETFNKNMETIKKEKQQKESNKPITRPVLNPITKEQEANVKKIENAVIDWKTLLETDDKPVIEMAEVKKDIITPIVKRNTYIIPHNPYYIDSIPDYWINYIPEYTLINFHNFMLSLLDVSVHQYLYDSKRNPKPLLYQITDDFFPAFSIDENNIIGQNLIGKITIDVKIYELQIRFMLLFFGLMTAIMQQYGYELVMKGGKAIQQNCTSPYKTNDIDILVVSDKTNRKEIAIEMSKLLIWIISHQPSSLLYYMSVVEIVQDEPIIKISIIKEYDIQEPNRPRHGYVAVVDIGINEPKEEIKSYITDIIKTNPIVLPDIYGNAYPLQFISQSVKGLMKEKLYYYLKYVVLKDYKEEDKVSVEYFIPKIYKSLKALTNCKKTNKKTISDMIDAIIYEKKKYLTNIELNDRQVIVNDIMSKIQ